MALWILSGTTRVSRYQKGKTVTAVEIVDGSHHRRGDVVDAGASTPSHQGHGSRDDIAIASLGRQSNPQDCPGSRIAAVEKLELTSNL